MKYSLRPSGSSTRWKQLSMSASASQRAVPGSNSTLQKEALDGSSV